MNCYFQTPTLAMRYPELLDGSSSVTNLTLACGDGSLASHKILVAGVSSFIKNILADIPIGDDVTLILPDFAVAEVDIFLKSVTLKEETNNFDLSLALGRHVNISFTARSKEESLWVPVQQKMKVELEEKEEEKDFLAGIPSDSRSTFQMFGEEDKEESDVHKTETLLDTKVRPDKKREPYKRQKPVNKKHKIQVDYATRAKELNIDVEKNIKDLEDEICRTPSREEKIRKQILFQKAMGDLISGQYTCRQAARKWGITFSTLHMLFHSGGKNYDGRGFVSKVFTKEEEERIRDKVLEISDGGKNLTPKIVNQVMKDEISILQVNYPDKYGNLDLRSFASRFARRHNLTKIMEANKLKKKERNQYDCDMCGTTFTFKNSLMFHRRKIHFLN